MHILSIIRIVGLLIALFSGTMLLPALIAFGYRDGGGSEFIKAFIIALSLGFLLWFPSRRHKHDLGTREGFLIVVLFWTVLGSVGALPFILGDIPAMSISESFFESFSGLTTTGATVITQLESLPKAFLFYRQLLQWLGGMGIVVLAVAILPLLGIGGMQLYRAEIPGPVKDHKVTPRITETAKALWYIYLFITLACALAFWSAGMTLFDAICHSFSTVAIGGFSTYDASIGHFNSTAINGITIIFLLISGVNFTLHFAAFSHGTTRITVYLRDPEVRVFLGVQLLLTAICFLVLTWHNYDDSLFSLFNHALFQSVSISTTAGFTTTEFASWPLFLPILLMLSSFIGGCAGSTGGGIKVVRIMLLHLQGLRELKRLLHPRAIYLIKLGNKALSERVIEAVWGFFAAYAMIFILCMLGLIATGMDEFSAFSAVVATLNNLGPGLGTVSQHFATTTDSAKWIMIVAMLFGRLEIFTLLVLFTPAFWRN